MKKNRVISTIRGLEPLKKRNTQSDYKRMLRALRPFVNLNYKLNQTFSRYQKSEIRKYYKKVVGYGEYNSDTQRVENIVPGLFSGDKTTPYRYRDKKSKRALLEFTGNTDYPKLRMVGLDIPKGGRVIIRKSRGYKIEIQAPEYSSVEVPISIEEIWDIAQMAKNDFWSPQTTFGFNKVHEFDRFIARIFKAQYPKEILRQRAKKLFMRDLKHYPENPTRIYQLRLGQGLYANGEKFNRRTSVFSVIWRLLTEEDYNDETQWIKHVIVRKEKKQKKIPKKVKDKIKKKPGRKKK